LQRISLFRFSPARGEQERSPTFEIPKFASRRVFWSTWLLRLEAKITAEPNPRLGSPVNRWSATTFCCRRTPPAPKETWMPLRATRSEGSAVTVLVLTLPVGPPSAAQPQPEKTMPLFW